MNPGRLSKGLYWDRAWYLVQGCTPVSEGCENCWAAREAHMRVNNPNPKIKARHEGLTTPEGKWNGQIRLYVLHDIAEVKHKALSTDAGRAYAERMRALERVAEACRNGRCSEARRHVAALELLSEGGI